MILIGLEPGRELRDSGGCGESRDGPAIWASDIEVNVSRRILVLSFSFSLSVADFGESRLPNEADQASRSRGGYSLANHF